MSSVNGGADLHVDVAVKVRVHVHVNLHVNVVGTDELLEPPEKQNDPVTWWQSF